MAALTGTPAQFTNNSTYTAAAGSNRVIIFCITFTDNDTGNSVTALTFGGVACHLISDEEGPTSATNRPYVSLWYMNEADTIPSGAQTVTATFALSPVSSRIHALTIQAANQTDFSVTDTQTSASATSLSGSLTSLDSSVVVAALDAGHDAGNTDTTWTGLTERTDLATGAPSQRVSVATKDVATGGAESFSPSLSVAVPMTMIAVLVKDISSSTTATINPITGALTLSGKLPTTSAFQNVRIREVLVNGTGQPISNATDITLLVWYAGQCGGAPDVSLNGLTTDSEGTTSWSIATGGLSYQSPVFYVAQNAVSLSHYTAARMIPSYE